MLKALIRQAPATPSYSLASGGTGSSSNVMMSRRAAFRSSSGSARIWVRPMSPTHRWSGKPILAVTRQLRTRDASQAGHVAVLGLLAPGRDPAAHLVLAQPLEVLIIRHWDENGARPGMPGDLDVAMAMGDLIHQYTQAVSRVLKRNTIHVTNLTVRTIRAQAAHVAPTPCEYANRPGGGGRESNPPAARHVLAPPLEARTVGGPCGYARTGLGGGGRESNPPTTRRAVPWF